MKIKSVKVRQHSQMGEKPHTAGLYFFPADESIMDNLVNRHFRPYKEYRKLINEALEKAGMGDLCKHITARWSKYCGCQCGCSSGFKLQGLYGKDIFVDLK
jgi:hypothetical protein